MTRIIGGSAGGRRLQTPPGDLTRPTADRVREALFSALESQLGSFEGVRFLDLYAGSGAVGLEAASRGAATVALVEKDRRTALVAEGNARTVGLADVRVTCAPVTRHLAGRADAPFDVAFLDPPYAQPIEDVLSDLAALGTNGWLAPGAVVVVERATRDTGRRQPLPWPEGYHAGRLRTYGETSLSFATWSTA